MTTFVEPKKIEIMENQFKGTPKPWVLDFSHEEKKIINIFCGDYGTGGENWANFTTYNAKDEETQKANALLISKAPEMLEMLIELREIFKIYDVNPEQQFFKYKEPLQNLINSATNI